jgi:hypothetical protein
MISSKSYGLQNETRQYLRRLYAYGRELAPTDVADIDNFIKGLKQLNFWGNVICWPMRSIHNIGTGSTVLSLGKMNDGYQGNGTLLNSPTWSSNGIVFDIGSIHSMQWTNFRYPLYFMTQTTLSVNTSVATDINLLGTSVASIGSPNSLTLKISNLQGRTWRTWRYLTSSNHDLIFTNNYDTSWRTITCYLNNTFKAVRNNKTQIGSTSIDATFLQRTITDCIGAATASTTFRFHGTIASHLITRAPISSTESDNLHDLVKTTIGKGLNLP